MATSEIASSSLGELGTVDTLCLLASPAPLTDRQLLECSV